VSLEILIPTCNRPTALAATLTSLLAQTERRFSVVVSDQTPQQSYLEEPEFQTIYRVFERHGQTVRRFWHQPARGMAEQRQFLLEQSQADYVLYLDDDLILEPEVVELLWQTIEQEQCGFVGMAPIGLSYVNDYRPHQHHLEIWEGPVCPEPITWETIPWPRHLAHNAANPLHLGEKVARHGTVRYKVAWVGACVLYDRYKLLDIGGYSFWKELPAEHCGEDVTVQLQMLRRFGGCGLLPSGVYHQELPTTIPNRRVNAADLLLPRLLASPPH